jgi:two-component system sensor histidine kinase RegB
MPFASAFRGSTARRGPSAALLQLTATRAHLQHIFWARSLVIVSVCAVAAYDVPDLVELRPWSAGLLALAALLNLATWLRLRRPQPVSYGEFLVQILADVGLIAAALHHTGGSNSPLADLSYVPLTVAAATLPWRQVAVVFAAIYGLHELVCHYLPTLSYVPSEDRNVDLLVGAILACFVFAMARSTREHDALLATAREIYLKERLAAQLGGVAAATVHQLGSPLATMAVVVEDLQLDVGADSPHQRPLALLAEQIADCKRISSRLMATAGHHRADAGRRLPADRFIADLVEKCTLLHPWLAVDFRQERGGPAPHVVTDALLEQAIMVLLQSAPGVPRRLEIAHRWDDTHLHLHVCERGEAPEPLAQGHPHVLLAKTTIDRFGGKVGEKTHPDGRTCLELSLPLSS